MMKIETYGEILSRKVRKLYQEIMPSNYYDIIKDIAHPEDIREVLISIAGKLGIDIIVKETEKYGIKTYEVYLPWNSLPVILGCQGTERQLQTKAADWKFKGWVDNKELAYYKDIKSNDCSRAIIATSSLNDDRNSSSNVDPGANIRNDTVYVKIDGLTQLLCKCDALSYNVDALRIWINTNIEVSKYYSHLASEAHIEYNNNYTKQLKDLHYREIASINEIPMPSISKGYLYIGTDPSHLAKCQYKLGMTARDVKYRLSNSQTSNPEYYYIYSVEVKEPNEAEHILHTLLTKIGMKIAKEWYQLPSEEAAIVLVNKVVEMIGCLYDDEYIERFIQCVRSLKMTT